MSCLSRSLSRSRPFLSRHGSPLLSRHGSRATRTSGPRARMDGWDLMHDVQWTITDSPDEASFFVSSWDPASWDALDDPFRPLMHDEKDAIVQPPTTFPNGSWRIILGTWFRGAWIRGKWFPSVSDTSTKIEPGATVQDVLTKISVLAACMEAPFEGRPGGCFGDHVFFEGFTQEERAGVYRVSLGS